MLFPSLFNALFATEDISVLSCITDGFLFLPLLIELHVQM